MLPEATAEPDAAALARHPRTELPHATPTWTAHRVLALVALAMLLAGVAWRAGDILTHLHEPITSCDGRINWNMATNLAAGQGLTVTDEGIPAECVGRGLGASHHYGPLMPALMAGAILVLGASPVAGHLTLGLVSLGLVAAMYAATRDLFGRRAGLLAAGALAVDWVGIVYGTRAGYTECLVQLTFLATLWAILRGVRDERLLPLAGLFAGLGYLSKATVGWFFLLAGLGGLAWRVAYRGWGVLRSRHYWGAIVVFGLFVASWSARNLYHFWDGTLRGLLIDWQTSRHIAAATEASFGNLPLFAEGLLVKLPMLLLSLLVPYAFLAPEIREAARRWRDERVSGVLLALGLVFALAWIFAALFYVYEGTAPLWADTARYTAPAQVPLLWLAVSCPPRRLAAWRWAAFGATALLVTAVMPGLHQPGQVFGQGG